MEDELQNTNYDMSGIDPLVGQTIKVLLPKGIDFVWNKIVGKRILLCGMGRAGKTSFADYLTRGILLRERKTEKTTEHDKIRDTIIQLNNKSNFQLRLKNSIDSPGQLGTIEQAASVVNFRPHYLFIFLDCSKINTSIEWLEDFCESLDSEFRLKPDSTKKLKSIFVVLNKFDKIEVDEGETIKSSLKNFMYDVENQINEYLKHSFLRKGKERKIPHIFPAICVKTKNGSDLIDEVINSLASKF